MQSSCFFVLPYPTPHRHRRTTADADTEGAHRKGLLALVEFMARQERGADRERRTRRATDSKGVHGMGLNALVVTVAVPSAAADGERRTKRASDSKGVHRMGVEALVLGVVVPREIGGRRHRQGGRAQESPKGAMGGACSVARCGGPGASHHRRVGHAPRAQHAPIASGRGVEGCLPPCPGQRSLVACLGRHFTGELQTRAHTWLYLSTRFLPTSIVTENLMVANDMYNHRIKTLH